MLREKEARTLKKIVTTPRDQIIFDLHTQRNPDDQSHGGPLPRAQASSKPYMHRN